jgi:hypothetical protein
MKPTKSKIFRLALMFALNLKAELGAKKFKEVCRRNATPEYKNVCASHDFCDANMTMLRSFEEVAGKCDLSDQTHLDLMNAAWSKARSRYL